MKTIEILDNTTGETLETFEVDFEEDVTVFLTRDRKTRQRYLTVKKKNSDIRNADSRKNFPVDFPSDISVSIRVTED